MKILNFGSCNIDFVYSMDHIVKIGETETTHKLETFPGGKGLNQSIALARAGAYVYHAGCIGNDGDMLLQVMVESGVDVSFIKKVDSKNGHAIIQVSAKGDNSIFLYPGSNEMISIEYIDSVLSHFSAGDIVLLQNEISNVDYIIDKAYEKGLQIVLNPSPFNEKISKTDLNKITYLVLNEVEAKEYTGYDHHDGMLNYFRNHYPNLKIMLTLGENGCIYMDSEHEISHPVYNVVAVDTTAAGDTFTGYFIAGVSVTDDYFSILKTASCAAGISVSRNGAAPSIPCMSEVSLFMNTMDVKENFKPGLKNKIEMYIQDNIANISLKGLADYLGYSAVYTGNLVKKFFKMSFSELVKERRCQLAARLLSSTDLSVSKIVHKVGYENESFFRKIFTAKYGKKPLEYRKKINTQD